MFKLYFFPNSFARRLFIDQYSECISITSIHEVAHRAFDLVKGTLSSNKEPGTFRRSRQRCLTWPFVVSPTSVAGPKSTLNITDYFNCTTSNIIIFIAFNDLIATNYIFGKPAVV